MPSSVSQRSWRQTLVAYGHPRVVTMLFLGFSAGLPLLLIFGTLSVWLREAGLERSTITFLSWAGLGYGFKFVWAPLVDRLPLPWLSRRLGRRRAWLLLSQAAIISAILAMALNDPADSLLPLAVAAVLLGFSSATQDIVIDAYRIESAPADLQALMSSTYIAGYRIGMLAAGAGGLKLAAWFGSADVYAYEAWRLAYLCMAATMLVGVVTTLVIREPQTEARPSPYLNGLAHYLRFLGMFLLVVAAFVAAFWGFERGFRDWFEVETGHFGGFLWGLLRLLLALAAAWWAGRLVVALRLVPGSVLRETYLDPLRDFFRRYGRMALLILLLIGCYRISDIVLGVISNVFYTDLGFDKHQIADITKTFGLLMTLLGGFLGGALALRYGVMRILFLGALLSAGTNLLFMVLAQQGPDVAWLVLVISADNISGGIAAAAFVAYLSGLTQVSFTAFQYALFSSLMLLVPKFLGGYSGTIVDAIGYQNFFMITALIGLPVLLLIWLAARYVPTGARAVAAG